ncbi:SHOCT domain-containing protein [Kitasatospora sp. NPDC017646]|uniref:SHOCT domain-containing protein n=1 Tax=Kitasatospora sp. NPDC017646 TaxID=3364024 RepID=UPI0037A1DE93
MLTIVAPTGSHRLEDVTKGVVFAERMPSDAAPSVDRLVDRSERLAALRASGALTDEEFGRAEQRLIG